MLVGEGVGRTGKREDPRVRRTRGLIVGAFNELVAEKGHTGLTVQEIAERATINRATFYAHFADQYELFDHAISEAFRGELRRRVPGAAGSGTEVLRALLLAACHYLAGLNTACSRADRQFRPVIEARVQGELYDYLLGWMGRSREVAASVASWAIFGVALDWSRSGSSRSAEAVADGALPVIVGGLGLKDLAPAERRGPEE